MTDPTDTPAPSPTISLTGPEFQALLQLATWHQVGLAGLHDAFTVGDHDRAMWLLQLMLQHPCAARDAELVRGLCERIWPVIFSAPCSGHLKLLQTQMTAEVARLQAEAKQEAETPAPRGGLFIVPKPGKDLPS